MLAALSLLTGNWRLTVAALALTAGLGLLAFEHHAGVKSEQHREAARVVKAQAHAAKVTDQLASSARKAGDDASASQARIVYRTRTLIQRIPQDVPIGSAADFHAGWVRNYEASLGLPDRSAIAGLPADQPVVSAPDALAGIDANNAECLKGWNAYQAVVKLYDQAQASVNGFRP